MSATKSPRWAGLLFLLAGLCFLGVALFGHQPAFYGLFAVFVALGAGQWARARGKS